jgi:AcrR family transcriptional regulator
MRHAIVTRSGTKRPRAETPSYVKLKPGPGRSAAEVAADQRARIGRAMVELVAEQGYEAVKVSELARRAQVSTRTFYERFHGKQECLLETYDQIMRHAARRVGLAEGGEPNSAMLSRKVILALAEALEEQPQAARFACLDASAAGLAILGRMREAETAFERIVERCLPPDLSAPRLRPVLAKAIVAGLTQVFRSRLIAGRQGELPLLVDELHEWALCLADASLERLETARSVPGRPALAAAALALPAPLGALDPTVRERELLMAATLELAIRDGYWSLTVPRIRKAAGVSRQGFDAHFESVEACFVAALESLFTRLADFLREQSASRGEQWCEGFHFGVSSLCRLGASEPGLMRLALIDVFASGPQGLRHLSGLIDGTAERLRAEAPAERKPKPATAEAAMGAVWGIVADCISSGCPKRLTYLAPLLSFLALQPMVGVETALRAAAGV